MRSWLVWLMLMRNTSAPASNSRAIISALEEAGPSVATILARRRRLIGLRVLAAVGGGGRRGAGGRQRPGVRGGSGRSGGLLGGVGQLHGPGALLAGVDLEEAGAVIAARQAVLGAANGELLLA